MVTGQTAIIALDKNVKTIVTFLFLHPFNETWRSQCRLLCPVSGVYRSLIGGLDFQTLQRTCSQTPVLIMLRLLAILINFENRFIKVFEETKPLIKLR